jgi:hypothetical protein
VDFLAMIAVPVACSGERVGSTANEHPETERIKIKNNNAQAILFIGFNLGDLIIVPCDKQN